MVPSSERLWFACGKITKEGCKPLSDVEYETLPQHDNRVYVRFPSRFSTPRGRSFTTILLLPFGPFGPGFRVRFPGKGQRDEGVQMVRAGGSEIGRREGHKEETHTFREPSPRRAGMLVSF